MSGAKLRRRSLCKSVVSFAIAENLPFPWEEPSVHALSGRRSNCIVVVRCCDLLLVWCQTSECCEKSHVIVIVRKPQVRLADMRCSYSADPLTLRDAHEDWVLPGDRALHCPCVRVAPAAPIKLVLAWMQRATSSKSQRFDGEAVR